MGAQFLPLDGFVSHPDISGLSEFLSKTLNYSPKAYLQQVSLNAMHDQYRDSQGLTNQTDEWLSGSIRTRSQIGLNASTGSSFLRIADGELLPFNQGGWGISYRAGTSTGSSVSYSQGAYYHGFLGSWSLSTALRLARPVILSLETDTTHYVPKDAFGPGTVANEIVANELLERASLDWQFSHDASFDLGVRRISGLFAPTGYGYVPTAGTPPIDSMNLTAAFHFLALRNEFYVVYGNPNQLSTEHALFLKWIRYVGAPKGT